MKKFISFSIAVILATSLVACGGSSSDNIQSPASVNGSNGTVSTNDSSSKETQQPEKQEVVINETVLLDDSGVKITAKSLDNDAFMGVAVKLLIENDSGKDLTFQCRNSSVNGYMVDTMMSVDVVNRKKANDELTFMRSDLEVCGIETIADMEFSFHIFTTEGWKTYLDTPQIQIKTSAADTYEYTFDDSGNLAYEGNGIRIIIKGLSKDESIFGPGIIVYIENNSDKDITVQTRDVSVNGFMVDAVFSSDIVTGKHTVDDITFMSSDLEKNEISEIEDVELSFHIFEATGWDTIVDTDLVTISF